MKHSTLAALAATFPLAACSGLFHSQAPVAAVYELRAGPVAQAATPSAATLVVSRPRARPGLDSDRIAVQLADRRLDAYAGARWSAPLPDLVESLLVEGLRASGGFQSVVSERGEFVGRYLLEPEITDFEADYSRGAGAPTVRVRLHAQFGLVTEHRPLATLEGSAEVTAAADRQREVTAAFEAAYRQAAGQLIAALGAAAAAADAAAAQR
jgi:cholesterol transport system auxiliary component